ncbi:RNA polymerase sigma factor sigB [Raphanus sativus]|nr:RNA polymerase sigma factor sigB [Raphanus sativus]
MKSIRLISSAPPFLCLSRTRVIFKTPPAKRCSGGGGGFVTVSLNSNPEKSSLSSEGGTGRSLISRASISVLEDQSINGFKMQLGSSVSPPRLINPLGKTMSRSDQAFLLLAFIACTTSVAFTSFVITAVPTLLAMGRAASSFAKLADTARQELPSTLAAIRLSGMEISDLTLELSELSHEVSDGVNKSAKAVQAAEAGIRQIGTLAHQQTLSESMSSCLLPNFKCQPDSFSIHFRTSYPVSKHNKSSVYFQPQCAVSTSPPLLTSTLDVSKLRLPSFNTDSDSRISDRQWSYTGTTGPSTEAKYLEALASETLLTSDEAVVAAAAAEALALARAALKVAKDATLFKNTHNSKLSVSSTPDKRSKWDQFTEKERAGILGHLPVSDTGVVSDRVTAPKCNKESSDDLTPEKQEAEPLEEVEEELLSVSSAVRSTRQTERKARRVKGLEKTASGMQSVKTGSSSRKKRVASQEIDHNDPLRYLRMTTSSSKLLTAREEQQLSEGIQDLLKLERLQAELTERCGHQPTFSQWASAAGVDQKTLRKRITHGTQCKDRMIKSNIRLVISIAKNYQGAGMDFQDLVQEGCRGLVRGAEKFDATKGFKFSTYAHWWIKQAVRKSLSDQSRMIRLPFHMVEATYRVKEARKQLYSETGKQPKNEEVAEATGLSMKRLMAVLLAPKPPRSLDQKIGINLNLKPSEVISDPEAETSEDILMKQFMRQDLDKVLDSLGTREKQVIRWRFGMEDGRMKTLQEIGETMGVSRERVRQIESSAFRKLKNKKRNSHLQQYLVAQTKES